MFVSTTDQIKSFFDLSTNSLEEQQKECMSKYGKGIAVLVYHLNPDLVTYVVDAKTVHLPNVVKDIFETKSGRQLDADAISNYVHILYNKPLNEVHKSDLLITSELVDLLIHELEYTGYAEF